MEKRPIPLLKYLLIFIAGALLWSLIPKCYNSPEIPDSSKIGEKINTEIKSRDSVKKEANKTDSIRIVYKDRWHTVKSNPDKLPCDSQLVKVVHLCDTLILVDSTEIAQLKGVIKLDSLIISDYQSLVKTDSIEIRSLKKQLRKERFWKRVFQVTTGAALIFGVVR